MDMNNIRPGLFNQAEQFVEKIETVLFVMIKFDQTDGGGNFFRR